MTTTSSLSVAALARLSGRPERFAALHLFNPVRRMPLVGSPSRGPAGALGRKTGRGLTLPAGTEDL